MATNQKNDKGVNADGAHVHYEGGATPSKDEQAKHDKRSEAGKKGGETNKKEAEANKKK